MVDWHNDRTRMSFFSHILYSLDPSIQDDILKFENMSIWGFSVELTKSKHDWLWFLNTEDLRAHSWHVTITMDTPFTNGYKKFFCIFSSFGVDYII